MREPAAEQRTRHEISVVTICRNSAPTIGATMRSVAQQGCAGLEYIVIDGASSDGTRDVVASFGGLVDVFTSEPDAGISDAFNKGIALASGEIVALLNADDRFLPGTLRLVLDYFAAHPEVEVLHGDTLLYDGDLLIKRMKPAPRWWTPWRMGTFNVHPATFVRSRVYQRCGLFSTRYRYAMDDDLFARWLRDGVVTRYLAEPLARVQVGGISGRHAFRVFAEKRQVLLSHGYPRIPVEVQFLVRHGVQCLVILQNVLRRFGSHTGDKR